MISTKLTPRSKTLESLEKRAWESGKETGLEKGMREQAVLSAETCLKKGMDAQTTAEITNLSLEEVKAIAKRLGL